MANPPLPCPLCAALVLDDEAHVTRHAVWHENADRSAPGYVDTVRRFHEVRDFAHLADDAPTAKLPPIGATIRRRPPVPATARELKGAELLRALADAIDDDEDLADDERRPCLHCGHTPALHSDEGFCTYPGCECAVYE